MNREDKREDEFDADADDWICQPGNACQSDTPESDVEHEVKLTRVPDQTDRNCDHDASWEPLLCAYIDGELEVREFERVNQHLQACPRCSQTIVAYGEVDGAIVTASLACGQHDHASAEFAVEVQTRGRGGNGWKIVGRILPFAAAASITIALGALAFWPTSDVTADEITKPLNEVQIFQVQKQVEQELMLDVMQYQLRALQLELDQIARESPEQKTEKAVELADSVQQLLQQVQSLQDIEPVAE